tara:strand:+ start:2041 stop:4659 length:2619 start_codon:yes stop_codon:yes gene_type:complete
MSKTSNDIRRSFIDYFVSNDHNLLPPSSIIPSNDPTLLFTNAGMVQFKNIFIGNENTNFKNVVTCQKCLRAGGKHNDLENVGYTSRHHTFFEMLGNFSFGGYFKDEAIYYAWNFLTKELMIDKDKLWVTVHITDKDSKNIWLNKIGLKEDRINDVDSDDNFWSMGETGPCGPCTEIFYDYGDSYKGNPPGTGDEGERYVEIWNLVFMQYNRKSDGKLYDLPQPCVDTGMGLERITAVIQNVHSNYNTDAFQDLSNIIISSIGNSVDYKDSVNVIVDHIRSIAVMISDGIYPSNEGRGYVLRRIIRRCLRHVRKIELSEKDFPLIFGTFANQVKDIYPEVKKNLTKIIDLFKYETNSFYETLDTGLQILKKEIDVIKKSKSDILGGDIAFLLYDTYGFPLDLTISIVAEKNIRVDTKLFDNLMSEQRNRSKESMKFNKNIPIEIKNKKATSFEGYTNKNTISNIIEIIINGNNAKNLKLNEKGIIILDKTCFYAESGGQIGDHGKIVNKTASFEVSDTQKIGDTYIHIGTCLSGEFKISDKVEAIVDDTKRSGTTKNHSATHLLHSALRKILGNHIEQKGSLVDIDKLRFDFSHNKPLSVNEIAAIENEVNLNIQTDYKVETQIMKKDAAMKKGALALFGEKYADDVRVLSIGDVSTELCGGTHVSQSSEIGCFKVINEESVASGIRRIEAITGSFAINELNKKYDYYKELELKLNLRDQDIIDKINNILLENKKLKNENLNFLSKAKESEINMFLKSNKSALGSYLFCFDTISGFNSKNIKTILEKIIAKNKSSIVCLAQENSTKFEFFCMVSDDVKKEISAKDIVTHLNNTLDFTGGGKDVYAQCGKKIGSSFSEDFNKVKISIENFIGRK